MDVQLSVGWLQVIQFEIRPKARSSEQGSLAEGEGSVQLTVDLLVLASLDQQLFAFKILFTIFT